MAITWLASYPKSGNTWVRAFLTAYRATTADINALDGASVIHSRHLFDDYMGVSSSEMTLAELERARPDFHIRFAETTRPPFFVKVHDAFHGATTGEPLFPAEASQGAIYVVRNPLDVAVSYAHHEARGIDRIIDRMADSSAALNQWQGRISSGLPQVMSTWSEHVTGWLDQTVTPIHLVSYEALSATPHAVFAGLLRFAGLDVDDARLDAAIAATRFDALKAQEGAAGFREKTQASGSFFRKGVVGDGRRVLSPEQADRIVRDHGPVMARLGYLDQA